MRQVGDRFFRGNCECVMEIEHARQVLRVKGKHAALFDHRRRKRIGKAAARQNGLERFAAAFLAGAIGRNQSDQRTLLAGKRMLGQIVARDGAIVLSGTARQRKPILGGLKQRPCIFQWFGSAGMISASARASP
jgi:hypothetical protein